MPDYFTLIKTWDFLNSSFNKAETLLGDILKVCLSFFAEISYNFHPFLLPHYSDNTHCNKKARVYFWE